MLYSAVKKKPSSAFIPAFKSTFFCCCLQKGESQGGGHLFVSKTAASLSGLWLCKAAKEMEGLGGEVGRHPTGFVSRIQRRARSRRKVAGVCRSHMGGPLVLRLLLVWLPQPCEEHHLGVWWDVYLQHLSLVVCVCLPKPPTQKHLWRGTKCQAPCCCPPAQGGSTDESHLSVTGSGTHRVHFPQWL